MKEIIFPGESVFFWWCQGKQIDGTYKWKCVGCQQKCTTTKNIRPMECKLRNHNEGNESGLVSGKQGDK